MSTWRVIAGSSALASVNVFILAGASQWEFKIRAIALCLQPYLLCTDYPNSKLSVHSVC